MIARSRKSPESPASGDLKSPDAGNLPSLPPLETAGRGSNSAPWRTGIARSGQSPESPGSGDLKSPDQANLLSLAALETAGRGSNSDRADSRIGMHLYQYKGFDSPGS
jgi:hypothetical protein